MAAMFSFWSSQIKDHGMRNIMLLSLIYVIIFVYIWFSVDYQNGSLPHRIAGKAPHLGNTTLGGPLVGEANTPDLALDPERWKQKPLPHYEVELKNRKVVKPEEYYDLETDKIASNGWLRRELDEGILAKFEWSQVVDLSAIKKYETGDLDEKEYPHIIVNDVDNIDMPRNKPLSVGEASMIGRLYLKHRMSAPYVVLALPDPRVSFSKEVPPSGQRTIIRHKNSNRDHRQHGSNEYRELERLGPLLLELDGTSYDSRGSIELPERLFEYDPKAVAADLLKSDDPLAKLHALSIGDAIAKVEDSPKYFNEIQLDHDSALIGAHYDWRFFRGVLTNEEQSYVKERLMRAWSQFADAEGVAYWLAHGSMIGWYWNGMTMPWDTDNDIQMPIWELDRLAREFNGTLVLQHPFDDDGKFLIDVTPWYIERTKGNGRNVIDARFIDIENGAYIDITGLAKIRGGDKPIACKADHLYAHSTLSPMRRTLYEGAPSYVNHNWNGLHDEYSSFDAVRFRDWRFDSELGLWKQKKTCHQVMAGYDSDTYLSCIVSPQLEDCDPETASFKTCDKRLLLLHEHLRDRYAVHKLQNITSSAPDTGSNTEETLKLYDEFHPAVGYL